MKGIMLHFENCLVALLILTELSLPSIAGRVAFDTISGPGPVAAGASTNPMSASASAPGVSASVPGGSTSVPGGSTSVPGGSTSTCQMKTQPSNQYPSDNSGNLGYQSSTVCPNAGDSNGGLRECDNALSNVAIVLGDFFNLSIKYSFISVYTGLVAFSISSLAYVLGSALAVSGAGVLGYIFALRNANYVLITFGCPLVIKINPNSNASIPGTSLNQQKIAQIIASFGNKYMAPSNLISCSERVVIPPVPYPLGIFVAPSIGSIIGMRVEFDSASDAANFQNRLSRCGYQVSVSACNNYNTAFYVLNRGAPLKPENSNVPSTALKSIYIPNYNGTSNLENTINGGSSYAACAAALELTLYASILPSRGASYTCIVLVTGDGNSRVKICGYINGVCTSSLPIPLLYDC